MRYRGGARQHRGSGNLGQLLILAFSVKLTSTAGGTGTTGGGVGITVTGPQPGETLPLGMVNWVRL